MSIVGVVCLGVLLDLVVPEGQTSKYIKGMFALLIIFVIISPLPALVGKEVDLSLQSSTISVDNNYLESIESFKIESKSDTLNRYIESSGCSAIITVNKDKKSSAQNKNQPKSNIANIQIVLDKSVLKESNVNILISRIKTFTAKLFAVEENLVIITVG